VSKTKLNLLTEPLLGVCRPDGSEALCALPEVLAALGRDDVASFPALQVHQSHAWHAFLVQLAVLALHRDGREAGPQDAVAWARMLRALTAGRDEPWCLVVEDLASAAFLQPPVPERSLAGFKTVLHTPDSLDVLITARNHDVKAERIARATPAHWAYALVSLQTMEGFLGAGNYGIARMNGGFASRPCFAYAPDTRWGPRFSRDVEVVLRARDGIASAYEYPQEGGRALLWLEPWDGKSSLSLTACDPLFIEVCRRVRLEEQAGRLQARTSPTKVARMDAKEQAGVTGDPWTPVRKTDSKALTVGGSGLSYALMQELLLGNNYEHGAAGQLTEQDTVCIASVLVRGQGKTEGWHERVIPIPAEAHDLLAIPSERDRLAALADGRVKMAGRARNEVLKPALCALLQEGREKLDFGDSRVEPWLRAFDRAVDTAFFPALWRDMRRPQADADPAWEEELRTLAFEELKRASHSAPLSTARRYRAIAAGERLFHARARKTFSTLYDREAAAGAA
jgi:CRISPR system Cascade subunit CasA